jgi:hypothetical protein|tara:strand:- start:1 stop:510 length:510 start_codon:yes stop_codon:yes gene_type:complete
MFEFIENIPQIPEELLLYDIDQITKNQNKFGYKEAYVTYSTYDVSPELYDFLNPYFNGNIQIRYQIIRNQLPIHIDAHAKDISHVFNYALLLGGENVKTRWWKMPKEKQLAFLPNIHHDICMGDDQDEDQLLQEVIIPLKQWHKLRIDVPHDISKLNSPRIGITLWQTT